VSELAFTDPATRAHGTESDARMSRMIWAGSKHNDRTVPPVALMPRTSLLEIKRAEWAASGPAKGFVGIGSNGTTANEFGATSDAQSLSASRHLTAAGGGFGKPLGGDSKVSFARKTASLR